MKAFISILLFVTAYQFYNKDKLSYLKRFIIKQPVLSALVMIFCYILLLFTVTTCERVSNRDYIRQAGTTAENSDSPKYGFISLDLQEKFILGFDDDFLSRSDIEVNSVGTVYVLDASMKEVVVFDSAGRRTGKIGREGHGPGEFSLPVGLSLGNDDELYVIETFRIHSFYRDGTLRSTTRNNLVLLQFHTLRNGGRFGVFMNTVNNNKSEVLAVLDSTNNVSKTMSEVSTMPNARMKVDNESNAYVSTMISHSYTPQLLTSVIQPDRLIYANSLNYALHVLNRNGDTLQIIRREVTKEPISAEEKKLIIDSISEQPSMQRLPEHVLMQAIGFPENRPYFSKIIVDDEKRIYVFLKDSIAEQDSDHYNIDIFSNNGVYLYRATSSYIPHVIQNGKAYGKTYDPSSGTPTVTCWQITNWNEINSN